MPGDRNDAGMSLSKCLGGARIERVPISCDEVAWIDRSLERLLGAAISPTASHLRTQGAKVACILEIMDTLNLGFKDESAMENAVSDLQLKQRLAARPAR